MIVTHLIQDKLYKLIQLFLKIQIYKMNKPIRVFLSDANNKKLKIGKIKSVKDGLMN